MLKVERGMLVWPTSTQKRQEEILIKLVKKYGALFDKEDIDEEMKLL